MIYALPFAAILGAFGRRAAGGAFNQWTGRPDNNPLVGDLPTRFLYGVTLGLSALLGGALWWQTLLMIPAVWVGTTLGSYHSVDLARGEGLFARDWFVLMGIGAASGVLPALVVMAPHLWTPLSNLHWLWAFGTSAAAPIPYWLGWVICGRLGRPDFPLGFRGGMELGEAFWGALRGVGMVLAVG